MKYKGESISYDGLRIKYLGITKRRLDITTDCTSWIRSKNPVSELTKAVYFEIYIENQGTSKMIGIGLTTDDPQARKRFPGGYKGTVGYLGDSGQIFHNGEQIYICDSFGTGDTIGCLLYRTYSDGTQKTIIGFVKNGKVVYNVQVSDLTFYPKIGVHSEGAVVRTNLGEYPFVFNNKGVLKDKIYFNTTQC
jgi:hypothetical protein